MRKVKNEVMRVQVANFNGVGRKNLAQEMFVLTRVLGHAEISYFNTQSVSKWEVSRDQRTGDLNSECWVCEKWKYVIYFYERSKHVKNKVIDLLSRFFIMKINRLMGSWDLRRVAPKL